MKARENKKKKIKKKIKEGNRTYNRQNKVLKVKQLRKRWQLSR
jgi:hypothetical protein